MLSISYRISYIYKSEQVCVFFAENFVQSIHLSAGNFTRKYSSMKLTQTVLYSCILFAEYRLRPLVTSTLEQLYK